MNTTGEYILAELVIGHVDQQIAMDPSLDQGVLIAQFYGEFFFAVNALTVLAQIFLVARVFRWVGVRGALLVLPVVALLGYALVAFVPIFAILQVIKVIENAADYSVSNTAGRALYLPLPTEAKYQGKVTTDTFFWRFGDLLQGAVVFAGLSWFGFEVWHFAALNLLLAAVWLAVAVSVGQAVRRTHRDARASAARRGGARAPGVPSLCARAARGAGAWRRGGRDCVVPRHSGHDAVAAADAGVLEQVSTPAAFGAPPALCEAWPGQKKNTPPEHRFSLVRGSQMTDEGLAARSRHAAGVAAVLRSLGIHAVVWSGARCVDCRTCRRRRGSEIATRERAALLSHRHATRADAVDPSRATWARRRRLGREPCRRDPPLQQPTLVATSRSSCSSTIPSPVATGLRSCRKSRRTQSVGMPFHSGSLNADAETRQGLTALRHMSDGARANAESRGRRCVTALSQARRSYGEQLGETRRQAQARYSEAKVLSGTLFDWSDAASRAKEAAALYEQLDARGLYANAMLTAGYSLMEAGAEHGYRGAGVSSKRPLAFLHAELRCARSARQRLRSRVRRKRHRSHLLQPRSLRRRTISAKPRSTIVMLRSCSRASASGARP